MASATGENAGKATGHAAVEAAYSIMAADEVVVASAGPLLGEVVVRGRLISRGGQRQAGFQQTMRIWRGSRVIELLLELDPVAATGLIPGIPTMRPVSPGPTKRPSCTAASTWPTCPPS